MRQLKKELLDKLVQCKDVSLTSVSKLAGYIENEPGIKDFAPDEFAAIDPRDGSPVIYNSKRSKRPHDNKTDGSNDKKKSPLKPCPICNGTTTGIIDVADLSCGFTFINKNLFPCFYVKSGNHPDTVVYNNTVLNKNCAVPEGHHYLQWTSSIHDNDWHNMPVSDLAIVLKRAGALEQKLLLDNDTKMADTSKWHGGINTKGFVSIIKNYGAPVGGSLSHGHQQITLSNIISRAALNNYNFQNQHKITFSDYMQKNNSKSLIIKEFETASLQVPYFMRRPYFAMLFVKNTDRRFLSDLSNNELRDIAGGIKFMTSAYHRLLPKINREVAYNILFHTGPGGGLYIEFLPFTQETGGMEQLGLWVCQGIARDCTNELKKY